MRNDDEDSARIIVFLIDRWHLRPGGDLQSVICSLEPCVQHWSVALAETPSWPETYLPP